MKKDTGSTLIRLIRRLKGQRARLFVIMCCIVITWLFYYLQSYIMATVAENLTLSLRKQISQKLHRLPLWFYDRNKAGEILSRVTSDLDKVSETLQTSLASVKRTFDFLDSPEEIEGPVNPALPEEVKGQRILQDRRFQNPLQSQPILCFCRGKLFQKLQIPHADLTPGK